MSFEPGLRAGGAKAGAKGSGKLDSSLVDHAELVRQQLGCRAVVIRIAGRFSALFAADTGAAQAANPGDRCALAADPAWPPLPTRLRRAPGQLVDPLAAGDLGFAFYAGLPLRLPSGEVLGTLAALDPSPRKLAGNELATLRMLAGMIVEFATLRLGERPAGSGPPEGRA